MNKQRCFIALDLPENIVEEIVKLQKELEKQNLFKGKFTEKENIHLTLKFLGEIDEKTIEEVKEALGKIEMEKFEAELTEAGVFSEQFIRIVWVTLNGEEVKLLQSKVDEALEKFGKEKRFMSHITIARVKKIEEKEKLIEYLKKVKVGMKGMISSFSFKQSTLTPEGPIYKEIAKYPLG